VAFSIFGKSIGFSRKTESKATTKAKPAVVPPVAPKGDLDFSLIGPSPASKVPGASAAPAPEPKAAATGAGAAPTTAASERAVSVLEDTVILFANGQAEEALATLSRAVRDEELGGLALQGWLMLFDLYQHLGMAAEFEVHALKFTMRFERSPPAWVESREHRHGAPAPTETAIFALGKELSAGDATDMESLRRLARKGRTVWLECGEVETFDATGCALLCDALIFLRSRSTQVVLSRQARLVEVLEGVCEPKKTDTGRAVWDLLFEIYRVLDLKYKFEEAAVNYAVTYEVSPPSWESGAADTRQTAPADAPEAAEPALVLTGELTGASDDLAKLMRDWVAANKALVMDISRVRRVDFVTAGLIFKVLSRLSKDGTTIRIRGASELIHALFRIMGIDKVANIIPLR
jgi:anti-anti-sigma regulatory factor